MFRYTLLRTLIFLGCLLLLWLTMMLWGRQSVGGG